MHILSVFETENIAGNNAARALRHFTRFSDISSGKSAEYNALVDIGAPSSAALSRV
jgi:hypothetical protein